jgi:pimeloyl-ACP methyl ester carboxylesterase
MSSATHLTTRLAYDDEGSGTPVVFLHGLTFDRGSWRPIVERLGDSIRSIAIDLPAHGESDGPPVKLEVAADRVHELIASLGIDRPVVVGHSMSAGIAFIYALAHPTAGIAVVDSGLEVRPFAEVVRRLEHVLRGPGFVDVWQEFEASLGLEHISEPERSLVLERRVVRKDVIVGYWQQLMHTDPDELQASIDAQIPAFRVPCLAVFGRPLTEGERERFERLPDFQLEEWAGDGHCVHLVEPDRFAARLSRFIDDCSGSP